LLTAVAQASAFVKASTGQEGGQEITEDKAEEKEPNKMERQA